ncbi:MAG TPA: hypothetical protein VL970_03595, partial [Candidatus Acidoferrales bacterium]|nr:hypothetical protein [Candidatus Acidoferrales bacterium]
PRPIVADHHLLRLMGHGSGGEVWLAKNAIGVYRAAKIIFRKSFPWVKPYENEFQGLLRFESGVIIRPQNAPAKGGSGNVKQLTKNG